MRFQEIVIETDRLAFPALVAGDGPDVVCWHGFPDHPMTFAPLAQHLVTAGRRVVLPFLRGFHPSTADALTYSDSVTLAADAAAVADALGGPVDMIGHDIGAGMVARVAAAWPDRLNRGITLAIPPPAALGKVFEDPAQLQRLFYMFLFAVDGFAEAVLNTNRKLIDYLWSTWSPRLKPDPAHQARIHEMYGEEKYLDNVLRIYRANFDPGRFDPALVDAGGRTEAVATKPLLVLGGGEDGCVDPRHFVDIHDALAPGSEVEILPRAGHFLHLEQPDVVAKRVLDWLTR